MMNFCSEFRGISQQDVIAGWLLAKFARPFFLFSSLCLELQMCDINRKQLKNLHNKGSQFCNFLRTLYQISTNKYMPTQMSKKSLSAKDAETVGTSGGNMLGNHGSELNNRKENKNRRLLVPVSEQMTMCERGRWKEVTVERRCKDMSLS